MENLFNKDGDIDFDKLTSEEREYYLKALEKVSSSEMTVEDWRTFISQLRSAVETTLVDEPEFIYSSPIPFLKRSNPKVSELKARLKDLLIFERYLSRSEVAKKTLDEYNKRLGIK